MSDSEIHLPALEFLAISKQALAKFLPVAEKHKEELSNWNTRFTKVQMYLIKREGRKPLKYGPSFSFALFRMEQMKRDFATSRPVAPFGYSELPKIKSLVSAAEAMPNAMVSFQASVATCLGYWAKDESSE